MSEDCTPESGASPAAGGMELGAAMDALRERGASRVDPVRFRFIESLARRAAAHEGEVRRVLDHRLAGLLSTVGDDLDKARSAPADTGRAIEEAAPHRGALAELVAHVARQAQAPGQRDSAKAKTATPGRGSPPALEALPYFRRTWSRLSADQRLTQSLSALPENAGPLNSHHLVHRSLASMRDLSPDYFDRFISYVDALLWLDLANAHGAKAADHVPRADGARNGVRRRQG
jgi:hypothetical protein